MRYGHGFGERRPPTVEYFNPPAEIRENTKARRAWCAAKQAELTAAGRVAKTVGIGSYQCVSAKIVKPTTTTTQKQGLCQGCGGQWAIVGGKVSHHGYQRPGDGWQTASCAGARYLPLSESAERAHELAEMTHNEVIQTTARLAQVKAGTHETVPVTRYDYKLHNHPIVEWFTREQIGGAEWKEATRRLIAEIANRLDALVAQRDRLRATVVDFDAGKFVGTTKLVTITK